MSKSGSRTVPVKKCEIFNKNYFMALLIKLVLCFFIYFLCRLIQYIHKNGGCKGSPVPEDLYEDRTEANVPYTSKSLPKLSINSQSMLYLYNK